MVDSHRTLELRKPHTSAEKSVAMEPVDIDHVIKDMHRLEALTKPFFRFWWILQKIRRWESSMLCIIILVITNGTCLVFPTSYYLLLQVMVLCCCAGIGMSHVKYRLLTKVLPSPYIPMDTGEERSHSQLMDEFRTLLVHTNAILKKANLLFISFYSILKWDDFVKSVRCYLVVGACMVLLNTLSLRCCFTLAINLFFLQVPLQNYMSKKKEEKQQQRAKLEKQLSESVISRASFAPTPNSDDTDTISFSQLSVSDAGDVLEDSDLDMSEKYESGSSGPEYSDTDELGDGVTEVKVKDTGVPRQGGGMMSRIIEFKKRQQQAGTGACIGCGVNFSSILKRRRTCTYCGNHYCSKCCCHKIPKTYFGATAPSAQMESVLVCHYCHQFLTAGTVADKPKGV